MKLTIILLAVLTLTASAINWEYSPELAENLRTETEDFLSIYEDACYGTFSFHGYIFDLPAAALTQIRADAVQAFNEMESAQQDLKDWATQ